MSDTTLFKEDARREPSLDPMAVEDVTVKAERPPAGHRRKKTLAGLFRRSKLEDGTAQPEPPRAGKRGQDSSAAIPIQLLMGYLPEVTERDALEYAMGVADKYITQEGLAFYAATKFGGGYIYEVHEGGAGKAYGPEIARHFAEAGPYQPEAPQVVHIKTAQRMVEVTQERDSVGVVLLPDDAGVLASDWLRPRKAMTPGIPRRKGMLYAGIGLVVSGTIAAGLTGAFFRLQGYSPAPAQPVVSVSSDVLPSQQWALVRGLSLAPGEYVKALRFTGGAWQPPEVSSAEKDALDAETASVEAEVEPKE